MEDVKFELESFGYRVFVQLAEDEGYLRWIVPLPGFKPVLNACQSCYFMDGKRLTLIEIIKQTYYVQNVCFLSQLFMVLDHLREEHLPDSNHAAPSSVRNVGANNLVRELREP